MARQRCVHCRAKPATRPRRLCWRCYYTPGIREEHEKQATYRHNGQVIPLRAGVQPPRRVKPASSPTSAPPATKDKVEVLAMRAARGEELWHSGDAKAAA